jgi:hypothetical protein
MGLAYAQMRLGVFDHGFFDKKNPMLLSQAGKNLLRSLPHEVPAQVGMGDNWRIVDVRWR